MKKLITFLIFLMLMGCSVKPGQLEPNLADYLPPMAQWDQEDIWEHNYPGNELPETCLFEVMREGDMLNVCSSPCPCEEKCSKPEYSFKWYTDPWLAARDAAMEGKLVVAVLVDDGEESRRMLRRFEHPCTKRVVSKHYKGLLVNRETYDVLRSTSKYGLQWKPGDYFVTPSMVILETERDGGFWKAYAFPISFEGVPLSVCTALKGFWEVSR